MIPKHSFHAAVMLLPLFLNIAEELELLLCGCNNPFTLLDFPKLNFIYKIHSKHITLFQASLRRDCGLQKG